MEPGCKLMSAGRNRVCVAGILVLAALIRLPFVLDAGITGDEANYVMIARCSAWDILTGAALDPSNPPLYMLLLHGLMAVTGSQVWAWKMMSMAMNLGMIYLMVLLVRRLLGNSIALMVGFLAAINPWQVYMATELRGYAMVGLCGLVALEAADRFKRGGSLWAGLWGAACAAGFWTHYSMLAVTFVTGLDTLIRVRHRRARLLVWCVAGAASLALMLLWVPVMLQQRIHPGGKAVHIWHLAGFPVVHWLGTTYLRPGLPVIWLAIGALGALAVFAPPLLGGVVSLWRRNRAVLLLFTGLFAATVVAPLVRSAVIGSLSFSARYTFVASVSVFSLLACGLVSSGRRTVVAVLIGIVVLSGISMAQFRWKYVARSIRGQMVSRAKELVSDEEALLVLGGIGAMRARYYSDGGFPHCFVALPGKRNPGRIEPAATWADAQMGFQYTEDFYTGLARRQLHAFKVVWYWQIGASAAVPAALAGVYRVDRVITLAPGGQFGAEQPVKLIRYRRTDNSVEVELPPL